MDQWWKKYVSRETNLFINENSAFLVEKALILHEGCLSSDGALVTLSGKHTGRASEDKYVVSDDYSKNRIDWKNHIHSLTPAEFEKLKKEILKKIEESNKSLYLMERSVGADAQYSLGLKIITTKATQALFSRHLFREHTDRPGLGHYSIIHMPELELDPKLYNLRSSTFIAVNFTSKEILIAGTAYAGEMKKAVFSVMNTLLPDLKVLPMHSGANEGESGDVSVFLGLSGTGKTTLSTDNGRALIGDDEHGISPQGIFNFEGGCYAKTYKLSEEGEPQVYSAVNRFGALLENVVLDEKRRPQYDDKSITENGRGSYPLSYIDQSSQTGMGTFPTNIFFLSADAMGVLPAVAKLNPEQAMYYFLSGYTAKLAGTEMGIKEIKATFSHCFGAPFMMRQPQVYADLLKYYMKSYPMNVWLINTGWYGGAYGVGKRYNLSITRGIIRAIQKGLVHNLPFEKDTQFGLEIPQNIPGIDSKYLNARSLWNDVKKYDETAIKLKNLFEENAKKIM